MRKPTDCAANGKIDYNWVYKWALDCTYSSTSLGSLIVMRMWMIMFKVQCKKYSRSYAKAKVKDNIRYGNGAEWKRT